MVWEMHNGSSLDMLGFLPEFLSIHDPRPAAEQINENYAHGGGWNPFRTDKWALKLDTEGDGRATLVYPGDPPMRLIASTELRKERILLFEGGPWMVILQEDGKFEVSRVD